MKKLFIILLFASACRKKDNVQVITDTKTVYLASSIIGRWVNATDTVFFTSLVAQEGSQTPYRYLASSDTVYWYNPDLSVFPRFGYNISKNNDTLRLWPALGAVVESPIYWRVP